LISWQSTLNFLIRSINDQSAFKAQSSETRKAISISAHHNDLRSFAQIAISVPDRHKGLTFYRTHGQCTNAYKSVRDSRLMSLTISYTRSGAYKSTRDSRLTSLTISYTRSDAYKSARDSRLTSLTISYMRRDAYKLVRGSRLASLTISHMRNAAYKSARAPDQRSIHLLLLSVRASPCTKSKGLQINAPYIFYYFQHAHRRVQKARFSISMLDTASITFNTCITTYKKQEAPD
jgi:hypothetical protein